MMSAQRRGFGAIVWVLGAVSACGTIEAEDTGIAEVNGVTTQTLEAETLTPSATNIVVHSYASASGGEELVFWGQGTATKRVTVAAADHITVRARGDQCDGAPHMVVQIDGATVLAADVPNTTLGDFSAPATVTAGAHTFVIEYTNDHTGSGCDRNLRADVITLSTQAVATDAGAHGSDAGTHDSSTTSHDAGSDASAPTGSDAGAHDAGSPTGSDAGPGSTVGAGTAPVGSPCGSVAATVTADMSTSAIQAVLNAQPVGAKICFAAGTYRITAPLSPRQNQILHGAPGAVLDGSVVLSGFTASGAAWVHTGATFSNGGPESGAEAWCENTTSYPCAYPEDVFYDGAPLTRVTSQSAVTAGTFYNDYANHAVYIGSNPSGHTVELGTTQAAVRINATGVTFEGLTVQKFASLFNRGALEVIGGGANATIQNCESVYNHTYGVATFAAGVTITHSRIHDNGALGVSIGGDNAVTEYNDLVHNNIDGFWRIDGISAGIKVDIADNATTAYNLVQNNNGNGIWHDEGADNARIIGNVVEGNFNNGILVEVSRTALIQGNTVTNNALLQMTSRGHTTCTGLTCGAGIFVNDGASVEIASNTLSGNLNAIVAQQNSRTARTSAYTIPNVTGVNVHDNAVTLGSGLVGLAFSSGPSGFDPYASSSDNRFAADAYHASSTSASSFYWERAAGNWSRWQGYGEDSAGSIAAP